MQRHAEPDRGNEHEPTHKLRMANREVHRDAAAERVAENERRRDRKARQHARNVIGELRNRRVRRPERRREREAGEIDDVDGPSQAAKRPDLGRESAPVSGNSRKNDCMRWCAAAPGG